MSGIDDCLRQATARAPFASTGPDDLVTTRGGCQLPTVRASVPAPPPPDSLPQLPQRDPGSLMPSLPEPPDSGPPPDEALLKRIRTALKALR